MSANAAFSVTTALKAATGFLPRAWAGAWLALGLMFVVALGAPFLMAGHLLPLPIAAVFGLLLTKLISQGALYRLGLFGKDAKAEGLGFGGLQIGRPELRLLLATLITGVFIAAIALTLFIVFAISLSMSGLERGYDSSLDALHALMLRHSGADYVFIIYIIVALLFLVFVGLKFALMPAANIGGRKLVALNALGLSSGNVGKLFIGLLALGIPFAVIGALIAHFSGPDILLAHLLPHVYAASQHLVVLHAALLALDIFVLFPLLVGFFASAYSQIVAIRSK